MLFQRCMCIIHTPWDYADNHLFSNRTLEEKKKESNGFCFVGAFANRFGIDSEMPASFFTELERPSGLGDDRALQLALELSMLGLSDPLAPISEAETGNDLGGFANPLSNIGLEEVRSKKSQNMTECVPVPSSEHVAEIVGRQGK